MLMIRFQRFGRKNDPTFRIVLTDKRNAPKSGKFLEILGFKNPKTKEKKLDAERIKYWLSVGAKTSSTVHNMLISEKVIEGEKINVVPVFKLKTEEKPTPTLEEVGAPISAEPSVGEEVVPGVVDPVRSSGEDKEIESN